MIAGELLKEISNRLGFLINVGLTYLTLDRKGPTLSGGESQRIRLASQVGSELTGVLYILDEPSIGLHQRDNIKLLNSLCHLRDIGNTLIIVEHDKETMETADWVVDIGPGAGLLGGRIVAEGTPAQIKKNPRHPYRSLSDRQGKNRYARCIGGYRKQQATTGSPLKTRKKIIWQTSMLNFPVGLLVAITGVSGAGKSTLTNQILYPSLSHRLHSSSMEIGEHDGIKGLSNLDKVINIDQKAIGRTPRSNPATYTKVFDHIRELFCLDCLNHACADIKRDGFHLMSKAEGANTAAVTAISGGDAFSGGCVCTL